MEQNKKPLTIERTTTLLLPAGFVEKLILEAIGAPEGATITSSERSDFVDNAYEVMTGARVTWAESEPHDAERSATFSARGGTPPTAA